MKTLFLISVLFVTCSCGVENPKKEPPPRVEPGPPDPEKPKTKWDLVKDTVKAECVRCHDGKKQRLDLNSEVNFKNSSSKVKISSRQMPPDRALPQTTINILLGYFQ